MDLFTEQCARAQRALLEIEATQAPLAAAVAELRRAERSPRHRTARAALSTVLTRLARATRRAAPTPVRLGERHFPDVAR